MRWLIIALLVSVVGLLMAAVGVALHVLRQRAKLKHQLPEGDTTVVGGPEASDPESES